MTGHEEFMSTTDGPGTAGIATVTDLSRTLRQLRRREARQRGDSELTCRELAARTGWSIGIIAQYFAGKVLPSTDRFDVLIQVLGATPSEQGALATARDRVEENQRWAPSTAQGARTSGAIPVEGGRPVPGQLPAAVRHFAGRGEPLARLDALLAAGEPGSAAVVISISGTAGVGKTTLAVQWAHRVSERFPDGHLYVNLRGFDPGGQVMPPGEAIRGFLDVLEVPPERIPSGLDAQAGLYRSRLAGRRMLIVLDNALDVGQVRPLLPGACCCVVLVTSRNQLTGLVAVDGAHPLTLDLPSPAEAHEMLTRRLGAERLAAEPGAVDEIITGCARLPLALSIAAARAQQTGFDLAVVAGELHAARGRLDALHAGDPSTEIRAVFSWSYARLTDSAARLFRLLGLHRGPSLSAAAAASLAGRPLPEARRMLAELVRVNLLFEHAPGRYGFHDLLRAYAAELVGATDPAPARHAATRRLLDHYLHTACAADRQVQPVRDPIPLPPGRPAAGVEPEPITDRQEGMTWLRTEYRVLLAALAQGAEAGFDLHAWQLAWVISPFLERQGHWHDLVAAWQATLRTTWCRDDPAASAFAHLLIANANMLLEHADKAQEHLRCAIDRYERSGDRVGQARTHRVLSRLLEKQGDLRQALDHDRHSLRHYRAVGHRRGQAVALNSIGWLHAQLGEHAEALRCCARALAVFERIGDRLGQAATLDSLGYVQHLTGEHTRAVDHYQRAVQLYREVGERYEWAATLVRLGDTQHAAGDPDAARTAWSQALDILTGLGHPDAGDIRAKLDTLTRQLPGSG